MTSWLPVENAVKGVGFSIEWVSDNEKMFLPETEELPVQGTVATEW